VPEVSAAKNESLALERIPHYFAPGRHGAPAERPGVTLALIADEERFAIEARRGRGPEFMAAIGAAFGAAPVDRPQTVEAGGFAFVGVGPSRWHAIARGEGRAARRAALIEAARAAATVVDVSHGFTVFRLSGDDAWRALAKLAPLDLDPSFFAAGDCAGTQLHGMSVQLRRMTDGGAFECAVSRSFGGSLFQALTRASERYGLLVEPVAPPPPCP
jgi:sarcosine oxidase subunit gamma